MLNGSMNRCLYFGKVRDRIKRCSVCVNISGEKSISNGEKYLTPSMYDDMIERRRSQSSKSLIIELGSKNSGPTLCNFCEQYGKISEAIQYKLNSKKAAVLLQYENEDSANQLLQNCIHHEDVIIPAQSRLLKFPWKVNSLLKNETNTNVKLSLKDYSCNNLIPQLLDCESVSEQLKLLHKNEQIDDLQIRLRFMVCKQFEDYLSGLFPLCRVFPFGSTVNGFGRNSSDLDMVLQLGQTKILETETENKDSHERLLFQNGKHVSYKRGTVQKVLETVGDSMEVFFPSTSQIHKILNARVPIVKFHHDLTNIDCDLSFGNLSGFYMSELIHLFGQVDDRLYPLVFVIRKWANAKRVTQAHVPGPWISNFSLSLLVIFFLQSQSILPTVQSLREQAGKDDFRTTDDLDCTFLRDCSKIPVSENKEELGELLIQFFKFYKEFDFRDRAISIITGNDYSKIQNSPLVIQNPLETELNVSKNVSTIEIEKFKSEIKMALQLLKENTPSKNRNWGILNLFSNDETKTSYQAFQVKELFDPNVERVLEQMSVITPKMNFEKKSTTQLNIKLPNLKKGNIRLNPVVRENVRNRTKDHKKKAEWLEKIFDKW